MPFHSLHAILSYLETERRAFEKAKDDRRFDHVFNVAGKVRKWLSTFNFEPGLKGASNLGHHHSSAGQ